ncbi:hypothetical protein SapgrDRAFT_3091 [Saprospira grandis DSM 2844]|uniref:Uncharacterized protein n=1 Tax=Saprospira grandis DSM 2844 TaxID=694433 RepID=J1I8E6_9BACT|nr:hypothetical protein [Saprospira grandis]EJF54738.1 hypothetical protein SapgrDRAFT_3091 [Saprospira grandis DSM 2844]
MYGSDFNMQTTGSISSNFNTFRVVFVTKRAKCPVLGQKKEQMKTSAPF